MTNPTDTNQASEVLQGDCLELMKDIPDGSVDLILADLPYSTTQCRWDTIIPFEPLWEQYERIIKDNGAIVLTASQPFTTKLINSNISIFRYEWIWEKSRPSNFFFAKKGAMKYHENILVFYKKLPTYNPIMTKGNKAHDSRGGISRNNITNTTNKRNPNTNDMKYPSSIIKVKSTDSTRNFHPTQKPVALFEYLIKTYTNEGDLVLDNVAGSGTTGVACQNLNRNFILMEQEPEYVEIIKKRLARIDELKDFRKQWHTLIRQEVHQDLNDRIATLEKEQERSKNDQL